MVKLSNKKIYKSYLINNNIKLSLIIGWAFFMLKIMIVKHFIENFVEHNTLIRLWHKVPKDRRGQHEEVIPGDKPMMEHKLIKSVYADSHVIGVTDIVYPHSHYAEAVNLVIER